MSYFSEVEHRRPPATILVPPEAWASTWAARPTEEVCIGLRFVADATLEDARIEAYKRALAFFPDYEKTPESTELFVASFQDALVRWVIAHGTCDPNDVTKHWAEWADAPEDIAVEQALSDLGARHIYDAWEKMRIEANIGLAPASDDDIALLPELLKRLPKVATASRSQELRIRRLIRYVLEELEDFAEEEKPAEPAD